SSGKSDSTVYWHAGRGGFREVYEPAEDSFLLVDSLEKDADSPCVCLEKASGSGVLSAFLASVVGPSALYLLPIQLTCTAKTAPCNNVSLQPVNTSHVRYLHGSSAILFQKLDRLFYLITTFLLPNLHLMFTLCACREISLNGKRKD
uniref:Uncharacterized protein n=1 Tax=Sander lucioperca TaxID=283035 RepID=A0A8D0CV09_SANLU